MTRQGAAVADPRKHYRRFMVSGFISECLSGFKRNPHTLEPAIAHFIKVTRTYRPGLFHCYAVPGLPRTDNDLEQLFGAQRYHERRATGRKSASPAAVLRGEVRLIAATTTRLQEQNAADLARTLRTRFRRDPNAFLKALGQQAIQLILPA